MDRPPNLADVRAGMGCARHGRERAGDWRRGPVTPPGAVHGLRLNRHFLTTQVTADTRPDARGLGLAHLDTETCTRSLTPETHTETREHRNTGRGRHGRTHIQAHTHTHTRSHMRARTHTHTLTCTGLHTHTHTHTRSHTYTRSSPALGAGFPYSGPCPAQAPKPMAARAALGEPPISRLTHPAAGCPWALRARAAPGFLGQRPNLCVAGKEPLSCGAYEAGG